MSSLTETGRGQAGRIASASLLLLLTLALLYGSFRFMRDSGASKAIIAVVALAIGIGGVWLFFFATNRLASALPERAANRIRPFVFVGPAVIILSIYIVFPTIRTIWSSFYDRTLENFIGLENYIFVFSDPDMLVVMRNTLLWLVLAPLFSVVLGLLIAVITDRLSTAMERIVKSLIFLPLAISFVGASVIWRFVYYYQPPGFPQIGLLNAILDFFNFDPKAWLTRLPWRDTAVPWINNLFLIFIMIWLQTGFAMVILSAAVKSVPRALFEAARIDGANEIRVFFSIIIPSISGTLLTVSTTLLFIVLKIFDIVFVMTSGNFDTGVVASRMYDEAFRFRNFGRGSALAVLLFLVVIPFMIRNIRQLREQER